MFFAYLVELCGKFYSFSMIGMNNKYIMCSIFIYTIVCITVSHTNA